MSKTTIEEEVEEILELDVKGNDSNTWISIPKKHQGKKAKVLILKGV